MYTRTGKFKNLIILFIVFAITGCSSLPSGVRKKGIVAWNYTPIQSYPESNEQNVPVSIRVNNFESKPSKKDSEMTGLSIIPIVSFFAPPIEMTNRLEDNFGDTVDLGEMEVEKILAEEIRRSGITTDIALEGEAKDFDINGTVNFNLKNYMHYSGLGMLYGVPGIALIFPSQSVYLVCETHISVVSKDTKKIVFEKDYIAKIDYQYGLWFYDNRLRYQSAFGRELFPKIVKSFISDLKMVIVTLQPGRLG